MKRLLRWGLGLALAATAGLAGCKGQPAKPETTSEAKAADVTEETSAPETTTWAWPLKEERLTELKGMAVQKRNEVMRGMLPAAYEARPAREPITVDGVLNEDDWALAQKIRMRDVGHGTTAWYGTTVKVTYDEKNLYVGFECDDPNVTSALTKHDEVLWKEDSVEVMIDADGDGKGYVELMVSAANVTHDAAWADFRAGADWLTQPTWERFEMDSAVKAYEAEGMVSAVKVSGTLNAPGDTDKGYTVELAIPWTAIAEVRSFRAAGDKIDMTKAPLAAVKVPKAGTTWRMNFLRNNPSAPLLDEGEQTAWSPTGGSVQSPCSFGVVRFMGN